MPIARAVALASLLFAAGAAGVLAAPPASDAVPQWVDAAAASGITFLRAGDDGENSFLPVIGGGACFADFDGDGYDDLYLVNGRYNQSWWTRALDPHSSMYFSNGDGTFRDVTSEMQVAHRGWGGGCSAADYDADGDVDLYVTSWGENTLYRNEHPLPFQNVTLSAGVSSIGKCGDYGCWGQSANFVDVDGDACLDLYVANYVAYNNDVAEPGANGPEHYDGQTNLFYRNLCNGAFQDQTAAWNLSDSPGPGHSKSFQTIWWDYDADGDLDAYVASDMTPNSLLRNDGTTFRDVAVGAGVADGRASMGLDVQDVSGDGRADLHFTHYVSQTNGFYTARADGKFDDHSNDTAFLPDTNRVGWGTVFVDWDADGDVDMLSVAGHTRKIFEEYAHPRFLYRHDAGFTFTNVTQQAGSGMAASSVARGLAMADVEHDGDLDFLVLNTGNTTANLLKGSGVTNHWLEVAIRQPGGNARAFGAAITVTPAGGAPVTRLVHASASFLSQHSQYEYFGLGDATSATVTVRWPDGASETWTGVGADRVVRLTRGDPAPKEDVFSPLSTASTSPAPYIGWHSAPTMVSLASEDRGVTVVSGVQRVEYRVDGGAWTTYTAPFEVGEGDHLVEHRAFDVAGNAEPIRRHPVRVDLTRPTASLGTIGAVNGWITENSRLVVVSDDPESGIAESQWRLAGEPAWTPFVAPFGVSGERDVTVEHRAVNRAGILSEPASTVVSVDTLPPSSSFSATGPALQSGDLLYITSDSRLHLAGADGGSGLARLEWSIDNGPWTTYTGPIAITGDDGPRPFKHRAIDNVGHAEPARDVGLFLDNEQAPFLSLSTPKTGYAYVHGTEVEVTPDGLPVSFDVAAIAVGPLRVQATATPDVSGNRLMRVYVDGDFRAFGDRTSLDWTWQTALDGPGRHLLRVVAEDGAGNERSVYRVVYVY